MVENVLNKLIDLFEKGQARFRVLKHAEAGQSSQSVAEIRGTELGQGAKALVCHVKGNGLKLYVLAVLPASLASPDEVMELTGCIFGAVPPVSFHPDLKLVADPSLYERYEELAFNAGLRDHSIIINTEDYKRIVHPELIEFLKENQPTA